jgi:nucleotide-binding universal stress UspA family protein
MKILIAVDGSKHSLHAVETMIEHADWFRDKPEIELVTVHLPVPSVGVRVGKAQLEKYYQDEGESRLAAAKKKLESAGLPFRAHVLVGDIAQTIVEHAVKTRCDLICVGSRGLSAVGKAILGSTATKVLQISPLPLLLVK